MTEKEVQKLMQAVARGATKPREALRALRAMPFQAICDAHVDTQRGLRCGFPEVIFCQGKSPEIVASIAATILRSGAKRLLATRADKAQHKAVLGVAPEAVFHEKARAITVRRDRARRGKGLVMVIAAGTLDIPVAEEARVTAEILGAKVETLYDVGVAGLHRLLAHTRMIQKANVLVVVAGMEGALPSVVGGLVSRPVIAVPTSIGYGASFGGVAPLLTMLNSCAAGVTVVNIDNGFGAGYAAALINGPR
ncbi:MAG: nickel pincer cofactor biosynthesis protein LarB [Planctomycetota bacterium]|nr:nickel pincer cofactor biosynthesis protein LarB [Planctomycetota bacterium]